MIFLRSPARNFVQRVCTRLRLYFAFRESMFAAARARARVCGVERVTQYKGPEADNLIKK